LAANPPLVNAAEQDPLLGGKSRCADVIERFGSEQQGLVHQDHPVGRRQRPMRRQHHQHRRTTQRARSAISNLGKRGCPQCGWQPRKLKDLVSQQRLGATISLGTMRIVRLGNLFRRQQPVATRRSDQHRDGIWPAATDREVSRSAATRPADAQLIPKPNVKTTAAIDPQPPAACGWRPSFLVHRLRQRFGKGFGKHDTSQAVFFQPAGKIPPARSSEWRISQISPTRSLSSKAERLAIHPGSNSRSHPAILRRPAYPN